MYGLMRLTCCCLILAIFPDCSQSGDVNLSVRPQGRIRKGDTIHIICETKGKNPIDILQLVKQVNETEYAITTNDFLKGPFRQTGRYSITKWNDSGLVELQITHILGVDGGNIGCKHLQSKHQAFTDIIVDVPVSSVELHYQATGGKWYSTEENDRIHVTSNVSCNVTVIGSNFKPEVVITIDGVEVTSRFRRRHYVSEENVGGFVKLTYTAEYILMLGYIDAATAGKNLTCWAKTEQHEPRTASAIVDITQRPSLECVKSWYSMVGQKNFTLTCHGKMDPVPDKVLWSIGNREIIHISGSKYHPQSTSPDGRYKSSTKTVGSGRLEFSLTIFEVFKEDFTDYVLEVSNEVGSSTVSIQLIEVNVTGQNMAIQKNHIPETGDSPPIIFERDASSSTLAISSVISRSCCAHSAGAGALSVVALFLIVDTSLQ